MARHEAICEYADEHMIEGITDCYHEVHSTDDLPTRGKHRIDFDQITQEGVVRVYMSGRPGNPVLVYRWETNRFGSGWTEIA